MILFITLLSFHAQAASLSVNHDNIKSLLESRNQNLAALRLELKAVQNQQGSFARSFLPSLEMYTAEETFKVGREEQLRQPEYGAELRINLFNGGRDYLESQARDLDTAQKKSESERIFSETLLLARTHYWNLLYTQELLKQIQLTLDTTEQNLKLATKRIQSGVATQTDRFEFEMKTTDLNQELKELQLSYQMQLKELGLLLNLQRGETLQLPAKIEHLHDFENLLSHNEKDHDFLFQEIQHQAKASDLRAKKESRAFWPKVEAYAAYNQFNQREEIEFLNSKDRTESVIGLKMTISLSQGLESERQAASEKLKAQALKLYAENKKQEVEIHIENEMDELRLKHEQIHAAEENSLRAEKYYILTKSEYSRGVKNSPDVLGATEKLFETKKKHLEIIRDFQIAKSHVLSKMGK